jgi:hypothetical protein
MYASRPIVQESGEMEARLKVGTNIEMLQTGPDCLVGNGQDTANSARGIYNISIHQNFRLNNTNYYTISSLPISVTNSIPETPSSSSFQTKPAPGPSLANSKRVSCNALQNLLIQWDTIMNSTKTPPTQPYLGGPVQMGGGGGGGEGSPGGLIGNGTRSGASGKMTVMGLRLQDVGGATAILLGFFGFAGAWVPMLASTAG